MDDSHLQARERLRRTNRDLNLEMQQPHRMRMPCFKQLTLCSLALHRLTRLAACRGPVDDLALRALETLRCTDSAQIRAVQPAASLQHL